MTITIKNKTVELRYTMRAMMIYEKIQGATFSPKGLTDVITFFYSCVIGSDKNLVLTFDEFIDWLDEHNEALVEFTEWLNGVISKNSFIKKAEEKGEEGEKNA